jgi:aryl-alcohol dehydrogenase-like predicted oxidoreductase
MDYTHLGRAGLKVSRICLGTMNFSLYIDEKASHAIMDAALDAEINFFDTANVYGHHWFEPDAPNHPGMTEEIIGNWFAQGGGRRKKVVLATKLGHPDMPDGKGSSARVIKKSCEDSLRRLKTDYIDLYQMHHIDRDTPWEETWQAMEQLVREGKILYVGSSNFAGWNIAQANEMAKSRHFLGLVSEQAKYHLAERLVEMEIIPACQEYGMGLIPWSPLGGGLLGGVLKKIEQGRRASGELQEQLKQFHPQVEAYEAFCDELGEEPAAVGLAWLLHQPVVTAPIVGPRTIEHLTGASLRALEIKLSDEQLARLDEIWPGYKTAPEHFAW